MFFNWQSDKHGLSYLIASDHDYGDVPEDDAYLVLIEVIRVNAYGNRLSKNWLKTEQQLLHLEGHYEFILTERLKILEDMDESTNSEKTSAIQIYSYLPPWMAFVDHGLHEELFYVRFPYKPGDMHLTSA